MRVWTQDRYGTADVVRAAEVAEPTVAPDEALIRPTAWSVNSGDVRLMRGDPRLVRLFFGFRRPRRAIRGMDVAGVVVARGEAVRDVAVGDRIVAETNAAFADVVSVEASRIVKLPAGVSDEMAAALPIAGGTALLAIKRAAVAAGERVLVLGASGGVGSFAVALAASRGAHVSACVRPEGRIAVPAAERIFHRGASAEELCSDGRYDVIIDLYGDRPLRELQQMLAPSGRAALVAGNGGPVLGPIPRIMRSMLASRRAARLLPISATADRERLRELVDAVAAGHLHPHIGATFTFDEVPAALAYVDAGSAIGKVVITAQRDGS